MVRGQVLVSNAVGLHARPAAEFVQAATVSGHLVTVINKVGKKVSGTSILGMLSLGAKQGEILTIEVSGLEEETVLQTLVSVVSGDKNV
jgi:phosphocarrier protein